VVHHGGHFIQNGGLLYVGGFIDDWSCDPDTWGYFEVLDTLKSMGYLEIKELWYAVDRRLQLLYDDNGSINMVNVAKRTVHLFVVHIVSEAVIVDDDVDNNLEYAIVEVNAELGHGGGFSEDVVGDGAEADLGGVAGEDVVGDGAEVDLGGAAGEDEGGDGGEADLGGAAREDEGGNGDEADLGDAAGEDEVGNGREADLGGAAGEAEAGNGGEAEVGGAAGEDEGGNGGETDLGGATGLNEVDIEAEVHSWDESDTEDEEFVDIPVNIMGDSNTSNNDVGSVAVEVGISEEENESDSEHRGKVRKDIDRGLSDDQWVSDELLSGAESDCELEDNNGDVFGMFVMPKSMADHKWEVGTYFLDKEQFRDAVRMYAIHSGRNIRFVKNDKRRIRVRCVGAQGNCPWLAYCALLTSHHN